MIFYPRSDLSDAYATLRPMFITGEKRVALFWESVQKSGPDECWPWLKGRDKDGYGKTTIGCVSKRAHRVAWELTHGPTTEDILHRCDNPPCCNPRHLFTGNNLTNHQDCIRKGRDARGDKHGYRLHPECVPRGERSGNAKLTDAKVREIRRRRAAGHLVLDLAAQYGVSGAVISAVARRKTWRHVP